MNRREDSDPTESAVEARIRQALDEGEFDDLAGKGKPLSGLDDPYDPLWWSKQLLRREGLSILPGALELRRDVERVLERLPLMKHEARVRQALEALNRRIVEVNSTTTAGPGTDIPPLDAEALVERWRRQRLESGDSHLRR